jgi:DNA adenine methylase
MEDYKGLRPFYCRIGSKWRIRKLIMKYMPKHRIYVEPFVGSGAIMWAKEPSEIEVINDKDKSLVDDYKLLKTIEDRKLPSEDLLKSEESLNHFFNKAPNTAMNKLTKSILLRCSTFGNRAEGQLYLKGNPLNKLKKIDDYQNRLKDIKIYNKSYEEIIKKYDSPDTFFYLDPPYEASEGLYKDPVIDYDEMRNILDKVKGKWLVSINDSPFIRKVFKGHYYKAIKLPSVGGTAIGLKPRKELIIANYPL